ncbi:hypothetical protein KIL84_017452 [Mauremys mutica]|uniref:Uncharacterized protein n=1 Tax=Mauremys mutica TaxID=74926 RepID=A0A9D3X692_9SAUR|nr:hypothetical protein KIL84_017452 [Mauremys mutica]
MKNQNSTIIDQYGEKIFLSCLSFISKKVVFGCCPMETPHLQSLLLILNGKYPFLADTLSLILKNLQQPQFSQIARFNRRTVLGKTRRKGFLSSLLFVKLLKETDGWQGHQYADVTQLRITFSLNPDTVVSLLSYSSDRCRIYLGVSDPDSGSALLAWFRDPDSGFTFRTDGKAFSVEEPDHSGSLLELYFDKPKSQHPAMSEVELRKLVDSEPPDNFKDRGFAWTHKILTQHKSNPNIVGIH